MAKKKAPKMIKITQTRSGIGRLTKHRRTLRALGIKRHQQSVIHEDNDAIRGMINQVSYMVDVAEVEPPGSVEAFDKGGALHGVGMELGFLGAPDGGEGSAVGAFGDVALASSVRFDPPGAAEAVVEVGRSTFRVVERIGGAGPPTFAAVERFDDGGALGRVEEGGQAVAFEGEGVG